MILLITSVVYTIYSLLASWMIINYQGVNVSKKTRYIIIIFPLGYILGYLYKYFISYIKGEDHV